MVLETGTHDDSGGFRPALLLRRNFTYLNVLLDNVNESVLLCTFFRF